VPPNRVSHGTGPHVRTWRQHSLSQKALNRAEGLLGAELGRHGEVFATWEPEANHGGFECEETLELALLLLGARLLPSLHPPCQLQEGHVD
jgi:hypothetical protein